MDKLCDFTGCEKAVSARGLCHGHYMQQRRGIALRPLGQRPPRPPCTFPGCDRTMHTAELCSTHYAQKRAGRDLAPIRKMLPRGSSKGYLHRDGYVLVYANGKRFAEHRAVMGEALGRALEPWENVHHVNGIRHDNRLENLELWATPQPYGQRAEDLARWVVETYPELIAKVQAE